MQMNSLGGGGGVGRAQEEGEEFDGAGESVGRWVSWGVWDGVYMMGVD
jgi:hypothetical protein